MKKIIIIVIVLIVIGALGFGSRKLFVGKNNSADEQSYNQIGENSTVNEDYGPKQEPTTANKISNDGEYLTNIDATVADASNDDVYLFFHAPWCSQCRSIEKGIFEDGVPQNITIIKIDFDKNQDLRAKYGVTLQTTFVKVNKNGDLVNKFVAYNEPYFSSVVRDYLKKS